MNESGKFLFIIGNFIIKVFKLDINWIFQNRCMSLLFLATI